MSFEIAAGATVVARKVKLIGISAHRFLAAELRAWVYAGLTPRGLVKAIRLSVPGAATNRHAAEITNRFLIVFSPFRNPLRRTAGIFPSSTRLFSGDDAARSMERGLNHA